MGFRTAYGNTYSENGWRMIDVNSCDRKPIPGTGLILPFRAGNASTVLRAWASWFNANVESLNNAGRGYTDEGSWTNTNDVGNSNHLSGTAMDLNWSEHAFRVSYSGFTSGEIAATRRGLVLFNSCIWWGQDWNSPKDPMHFQLNFGEDDSRISDLAKRLNDGYLGIFTASGPEVSTPTSPVSVGSNDLLEYGSHGNAVMVLQRGMNKVFKGYKAMPLVVDGDFGPKTESAVKEFQWRSGIEIDGKVGPITRGKLAKFGIVV